jgi:hypothetical protein
MSNEIELQKAGVKLQKEFADKRYRAINKGLDSEAKSKLQIKIEECAKRNGQENIDWKKARDKITKGLQKANLTINFNASSWFLNTNSYVNYTQMYQRSIDKESGKAQLKGGCDEPCEHASEGGRPGDASKGMERCAGRDPAQKVMGRDVIYRVDQRNSDD